MQYLDSPDFWISETSAWSIRLWTARGGLGIGLVVRDEDDCGGCDSPRYIAIGEYGAEIWGEGCCFQTPGAAARQLIQRSGFVIYNPQWFRRPLPLTQEVTLHADIHRRWVTIPRRPVHPLAA